MSQDLLDALIDRVAEAVVRKIEEQQKIDAIAQAVLDRLPRASNSRTRRTPTRNSAASKATPRNIPTPAGRTAKASTKPLPTRPQRKTTPASKTKTHGPGAK